MALTQKQIEHNVNVYHNTSYDPETMAKLEKNKKMRAAMRQEMQNKKEAVHEQNGI